MNAMLTWRDVLVEEQRRKDLVERSQKENWGLTFMELHQTDSAQKRISDRWLYALGAHLVRWGSRLQARTRRTVAVPCVPLNSMNGSAAAKC
jgi:hypothetical protein